MAKTFQVGDQVTHVTNPNQIMIVRTDDDLPAVWRAAHPEKELGYKIGVYWVDGNGLPQEEVFDEKELRHCKIDWE